ncbi:hypothetical protein ElyMa_005236800 [Elysia marginata]|uniref:Uncharacterized protein n=1 Tax=Elysia marginata TaxID=1093978 RepID=A0AAV4JZY5_9GAST|nr:hypothetical protein ElyMa_005236800 [Elysia marginata]
MLRHQEKRCKDNKASTEEMQRKSERRRLPLAPDVWTLPETSRVTSPSPQPAPALHTHLTQGRRLARGGNDNIIGPDHNHISAALHSDQSYFSLALWLGQTRRATGGK